MTVLYSSCLAAGHCLSKQNSGFVVKGGGGVWLLGRQFVAYSVRGESF